MVASENEGCSMVTSMVACEYPFKITSEGPSDNAYEGDTKQDTSVSSQTSKYYRCKIMIHRMSTPISHPAATRLATQKPKANLKKRLASLVSRNTAIQATESMAAPTVISGTNERTRSNGDCDGHET